ncbi:Zn-dependent exopeptidase [Athelia psychrophila]|uniref:Peptide hydrolase n=1 Tax=Athelia psychrophila TaxID=1759441 RepID=A0A166T243_9AGAM|nr:Zn-dependent exopeptidase [Fibularhizoctonia sp. CBS 109695]
MLQALIPSALLLVTPFNADIFSEQPCLTNGYYGFFNGQSVFSVDSACFESNGLAGLESGSLVPSYKPIQQLVWLQEEAVDQSLWDRVNSTAASALDDLLARLALSRPGETASDGQQVFQAPAHDTAYELLHRTPSSALVSLSPEVARTIDTLLPPFYKSALLPTAPVPYVPVPSPAVDRVKALLKAFRFDPYVAAVVNSISLPWLRNDVRWLTGEDPTSHIVSRHSFATGARVAAGWLKERFEDQGAVCELRPFRAGFAPNVICRYAASVKTNATVLLSAHYDSRGSFGSMRAPGGDDDGSGVMALLGIARAIYRKGVTFRSNVELVAFAGEEQGLLGSKAYARELREANANITLMMQADMIAYRAPGEPPQLGLPELIGTPEVSQLIWNASNVYSPELKVGWTTACCSDHQSFHMEGFPAAQVFERAGTIVDPMYHNSGDLSDRDNFDFEQARSIAKVEFAVLLHAAGWDLPDSE